MSNHLPVSHYPNVYEGRVQAAEKGVAHPKAHVLDGMKRLVAALRELDPTEEVGLEAAQTHSTFTRVATQTLIARIDFEELKA